MQSIRIFVVEDDPIYILDLERILEECGHAFVGQADNAEDALNKLAREAVDLVLMDINIKGNVNGVELAQSVVEMGLPVIFLTAFEDEQTYQAAREASNHGYLVKPVNKFTLQAVVESAILRYEDSNLAVEVFRLWQENELLSNALFIKSVDKLVKILISDICIVEADGNYSVIYTDNRKFAVKEPLKRIKQRLSARRFIQVHRSYLVQLPLIESISLANSELEIVGRRLPIGARYKNQLLGRLNIL